MPKNYRSANVIFGRSSRIACEEVILQLINSKCIPMLIYGMEVSPFKNLTSKV